jgi:hypothetical protein
MPDTARRRGPYLPDLVECRLELRKHSARAHEKRHKADDGAYATSSLVRLHVAQRSVEERRELRSRRRRDSVEKSPPRFGAMTEHEPQRRDGQ